MKINKKHLAFKLRDPKLLRFLWEAKQADPKIMLLEFDYFRSIFMDIAKSPEECKIYMPTKTFIEDSVDTSVTNLGTDDELEFPSKTGILMIADKAIIYSLTDESLKVGLIAEGKNGIGTVGFIGFDVKKPDALIVPKFLRTLPDYGLVLASTQIVMYMGLKKTHEITAVSPGKHYKSATAVADNLKNQSDFSITVLDRGYRVIVNVPEREISEHFRNQWYGSKKRGDRRQELIIVKNHVRKAHTRGSKLSNKDS